ncbi:class I SAM-dependent methyltransferase [Erysipelotrichaceae bacterium OttesenSCG-928-M19]|nr:class I SAM-dependent methyltransferase [Erysipelotrichaceae bacterium OttesenSCG-928-M19]
MKLTNRLHYLASLVNKDAILVDVGCDHGYLPLYLLKNNIIKKAYALDINQGPLDNVKANAIKYGLDKEITCLLSDGLDKVRNYDFNSIVIAGMGATLIIEILGKNLDLLGNKQLVLQANVNNYALRKWLIGNNFMITNELLVKDDEIIYQIIEAKQGESSNYNELELSYGRQNINENNFLLLEIMNDDLKKYQSIIKQIPNDSNKYHLFKNRIELIRGYLDETR